MALHYSFFMIDYKWYSFLTVIEEGTLDKAAGKLGLTQPAVSQHLGALESYYGQPLFDHSGRKLVLNEAGYLVKELAEEMFNRDRQLERSMKRLIGGRSRYSIGATLTVGEFILPPYIGRYCHKFPLRDITMTIANTVSIIEKVKKGEVDLAIVEGPFDKREVNYTRFMTDEMVYITDKSHRSECVTQAILENNRFILREKGSGTRYYWDTYVEEKGIRLNEKIMEVGSLSAIKSLVESGYGVSVMSTKAVEKELSIGSLLTVPFSWGPLYRELYFLYTKNSPSAFIDEFISFSTS